MIKKLFFISLALSLISQNVFAVDLLQALKLAYTNNPVLNAERENIKFLKKI